MCLSFLNIVFLKVCKAFKLYKEYYGIYKDVNLECNFLNYGQRHNIMPCNSP